MEPRDTSAAPRVGAARAAGGLALLRGGGALAARAALGLVRLLLASCVLGAALLVPVWIWTGLVIDAADVTDADALGEGEVVRLLVLLAVPAVVAMSTVLLAAIGGATIVLDEVAAGGRGRAVRALGRGLRATPRLAAVLVPAGLAVAALALATPIVVVVGVLVAVVTLVARRVRPTTAARLPSNRTLFVLIVPFGAALTLAARWSLLPSVVMLERADVRSAFRRARALGSARSVDLVLAVVVLGAVAVAVWWVGQALLGNDVDSLGTRDGWAVVVEGIAVLVAAAVAVRLFGEAGGVTVEGPSPPAPRVHVATVVVFALLAGGVQLVVDVRPAIAAVSGATIVVDDVGDADDATPGDGSCATAGGTCTLRAAISEANTSTDEVIGFDVTGTITVGSELAIRAPMTIDGDDAGGPITVSGGGASRVFLVQIEIPGGGYGSIRNLTIADGNEATVGGAAVYNDAASAGFVLEHVTIRDATAPGAMFGGAVVNLSTLIVRNSTFVGNAADATTGGSDIANRFSGSATIENSTFTGSQGSTAIESTGADMTVRNSIVQGPTEACFGTIAGAGNVTTDLTPTCPGTVAVLADLALTPLAANGGPTPTVRLGATSVAIDAGAPGTCLPTDQRGIARGATCDAGAYAFDPATTTVLTALPNPSGFGGDVTLQATVSAVGEPGTPSGSVELFDGVTSLGIAPLDGTGVGTITVASLAAGAHTLTAVYQPDAGYAPSTSTPVAHTVDPAATTTVLTSSGSPTTGGAIVTFDVAVTAAGTTPTGTVDLRDGATTIATLPLDGAGTATYSTGSLTGGHHDLTAVYAGDANHDGSTSAVLGHDVVDASATTLTGPAGPTTFGTDASFDVTVAPVGGGPTPTGAVVLREGATTLDTAPLDASGHATLTVSTLGSGAHAITATYAGDAFNGPSTSNVVTHTVTDASTATALDVVPAGSSVYGNDVTVAATVTNTDSAPIPEGHVQFFDGATSIGTAEVDPSGHASWTLSSPAVGTYDLHATYLPANGFASSGSSSTTHDVVPADTTTALAASTPASTYGETVTLTATVDALSSPGVPVGSVTFRDGAAVLGTASLDGTGTATITTGAIAVGSRTLRAEYGGTGAFSASASPDLAHTVSPAAVLVTVTDTPDPSVFGSDVTLSITAGAVAPGAGVPTGAVVVRDGPATVATTALDGSGQATVPLTGLAVGAHTLSVEVLGDGNFATGSADATHTVVADTATVDLFSSSTTAAFTDPVTFTATVTGTGSATPTGTVTFRIGATILGVVALDAGGVARLTTTTLPYGTSLVIADYSGDAGFGTALDSVSQTIDATGTAIALTANPSAPQVGESVTLTATVAGTTSAAVPNGTVTFRDGATVLGTAPVDSSGRASLTRSFDRAVHPLTASFAGTPGWSPSTSSVLDLTPGRVVTALSLAGNPAAVQVGKPVIWTATIPTPSGAPAPTGTLELWLGPTSLGQAPLVGGVATWTLPAPAALGLWTVTATYVGDLSYEPASTSASVTVAAAASTTTAGPSVSSVGDPATLVALVTTAAPGASVTGTVRFDLDSPGFASLRAPIDGSGIAQVAADGLPAGTWTLTATYEPGIGSALAPSSGTATVTVLRRPATLTMSAPANVTVGQPFDVTYALVDATGTGPTPTGTVTVAGGGASCTATATAGRCNLTLAAPGSVTLTATSSGDATYDPATSSPTVVTAAGGISTLIATTTTAAWVTGDPITVAWRLTGPPDGDVVVRTPFGEQCRSAQHLSSCTLTLPFELRGQQIPIDVSFAGSAGWSPASATVTGTVVGCYPLTLEVVPADAGTITASTGNCNGAAGFRDGTTASVVVEPTDPYILDRWLEDASALRTRTFIVGETSRTATALMRPDCVEVTFAAAEQVDLGSLRSLGGTVDVSAPDCPGQPAVARGADGSSSAWFRRGSTVTLTGTPRRPAIDELKGWLVDGALQRSDEPLTIVAAEDVDVEGRFGVQCARLAVGTTGGGSATTITPSDCIDADGFGWQKTSRVGARLVPDAYHWVDSYSTEPIETRSSPFDHPETVVDVTQINAWWELRDDLRVDVGFDTCRTLTLEPSGPGQVEAVTAPDCPTRAAFEGPYYDPGTRVEVRAVADPPSTRVAFERGENRTVTVVPAFLRWSGLEIEAPRDLADPYATFDPGRYRDEEGRYDPDTAGIDPARALVDMADDRTIDAEFYDEGRCMAFVTQVRPEGAATVDVTLDVADGVCPEGEAQLADPRTATFRATPTEGDPRIGWTITTTDEDTDETVELRRDNGGAPVRVKNRTMATAYVCTVVQPEITLIAPDGSQVSGLAPPGSDFVQADVPSDCPLWENGFQVGQTLRLLAAAPPVGYEFDHWEGDVAGDWYEQSVPIDGSRQTLVARAVYRVRCVTITLEPGGDLPEYSPPPNCPQAEGAPAGPADQLRYIGGTPVMLDARAVDDHDFTSWTGEGLLDRDQMIEAFTGAGLYDLVALTEAMDHPAMITADFDMTVTANYREHSTGQKILDGLAVLGKKTVGVLSLLTIGAFESIALGAFRMGFGAIRFLTNAISPGATDTIAVFDRVLEMMDLTELTLLCTVEWSKGHETEDVDIGAFDNNGIVPPVDSQDVVTSTASIAANGVKLNEAITNYRLAKDPTLARNYTQKIPLKTNPISAGTMTKAKVAWAGLGMVAAVGTAIYSFVADGPGVVWEDTADQAWTTGGDEFEDCVMRHLHEAFPEDIPAPDTA